MVSLQHKCAFKRIEKLWRLYQMLWKCTSVPAFTARTRPFPRPTAVTLQTPTTIDFAGSDVCAHMYDYIASRTFMKVYQGHVCSKYQEILYKMYLHIYDVVNQCQYHVLNSTCIVLLWIYYGFATLRDWISRWAFVQCIVFFPCKWLYFSSHILHFTLLLLYCFDIFCMIMVLTLRGTSAWPGFHLYISNYVYLRIIIWKYLHSIYCNTRFSEAQSLFVPSLYEIPTKHLCVW